METFCDRFSPCLKIKKFFFFFCWLYFYRVINPFPADMRVPKLIAYNVMCHFFYFLATKMFVYKVCFGEKDMRGKFDAKVREWDFHIHCFFSFLCNTALVRVINPSHSDMHVLNVHTHVRANWISRKRERKLCLSFSHRLPLLYSALKFVCL